MMNTRVLHPGNTCNPLPVYPTRPLPYKLSGNFTEWLEISSRTANFQKWLKFSFALLADIYQCVRRSTKMLEKTYRNCFSCHFAELFPKIRTSISNHFSKANGREWICTVRYCTVLYGGLLYMYCTVLYCTVLYCTVLYCTVLYCTVMYRVVQNKGAYSKYIWIVVKHENLNSSRAVNVRNELLSVFTIWNEPKFSLFPWFGYFSENFS